MTTPDFLIEIQWAQQNTTENAMESTPGYAATLNKVLKYVETRALEEQETEILDSLYFVKEMHEKVDEHNVREYVTALKIVLRYAEQHAEASVRQSRINMVAKHL